MQAVNVVKSVEDYMIQLIKKHTGVWGVPVPRLISALLPACFDAVYKVH